MRQTVQPQRCRYCGVTFSMTILSAMSYFTFAALQGENGLVQLIQIEAQEAHLASELEELNAERLSIENKVRRLGGHGLDLDLLDERARFVLTMGRPDEIIIP